MAWWFRGIAGYIPGARLAKWTDVCREWEWDPDDRAVYTGGAGVRIYMYAL